MSHILFYAIAYIILAIMVVILVFLIRGIKRPSDNTGTKSPTSYVAGVTKKAVSIKFKLLALAILFVMFLLFLALGYVIKSANSLIETASSLFASDDECTCALKCHSDESSSEAVTSFALLYGSKAYSDFLLKLRVEGSDINKIKNGAEESQYVLANYNHDLMTDEEIKALQDQKIKGRNRNCPVCDTLGEDGTFTKCRGSLPKTKDWQWQKVYRDYLTPDGEKNPDDPFGNGGGTGGGNGGSTGGYTPGHAVGNYVVELDDGFYYYYHQAYHDCQYCGEWSKSTWGSSDKKNFSANGCAVYSLAMAISNLTGRQVTPGMILTNLGCTYDSNKKVWNTGTSSCFSNRMINREAALAKLSPIYGFNYKHIADDFKEWDAMLDQGGYVWNQWTNAKSPWTSMNGSLHFMVIRKKTGNDMDDRYYCFTSTHSCKVGGAGVNASIETMNMPVDKQTVLKGLSKSGVSYGLWVEGGAVGAGGEFDLQTNGTWYTDLKSANVAYAPVNLSDSIDGGFPLYAGLPWEVDSHTWFSDTDIMLKDLYSYIATVSQPVTAGKSCGQNLHSRINYGSGGAYHNTLNKVNGVGLATVEGVQCIAVAMPPAVYLRNYNTGFKDDDRWAKRPMVYGNELNYGRSKAVAVLEQKSTGKTFYLPCTLDDAKGHTFPGGVAQTNIRGNNVSRNEKGIIYNVSIAESTGDVGGSSYTIVKSMMGTDFNRIKSAGHPPMDYAYSVLEVNGTDKGNINIINNNFRLKGVIVYGDTIRESN